LKILLIEDCHTVAEVIFDYFEGSEFELDFAATGTLGLALAQSNNFDCIILDIMLPGIDGITVCHRLRAEGYDTPIIMLTARDTDSDMLQGLKIGADDYIVKPFNLELLEARIINAVRRSSGNGFAKTVVFGPVTLNPKTCQVWREGSEIKLTPTCFKIMKLLILKAPSVVSRQEIEDSIWGDELPDKDILRKHIYQLRLKIDKPYDKDVIETIPKTGYRLSECNV